MRVKSLLEERFGCWMKKVRGDCETVVVQAVLYNLTAAALDKTQDPMNDFEGLKKLLATPAYIRVLVSVLVTLGRVLPFFRMLGERVRPCPPRPLHLNFTITKLLPMHPYGWNVSPIRQFPSRNKTGDDVNTWY